MKQSRGEAEEMLHRKITASEFEAYEDPEALLVNSQKYISHGDLPEKLIVV